MNFKKTLNLTLLIFLLFSIFLFSTSISQSYAQNIEYKNVSSFDGSSDETTNIDAGTTNGAGGIVNNLLFYGVVVIAALAIFRVLYGGFLKGTYDNIYDQNKGKKSIEVAGIALLILISAYAVLSFINPRLTGWNLAIDPTIMAGGSTGGGGADSSYGSGFNGCGAYLEYFKTAANGDSDLENLLLALGTQETSGCHNATSGAGAKGIMQILPETASGYGCGDITDPKNAIYCAVKIIKDNQNKLRSRNTSGGTGLTLSGQARNVSTYSYDAGNGSLIASYNAGIGSGVNSDGTFQPFHPSKDCPNYYAWECPINNGGFKETQDYVKKVQQYLQSKPWQNYGKNSNSLAQNKIPSAIDVSTAKNILDYYQKGVVNFGTLSSDQCNRGEYGEACSEAFREIYTIAQGKPIVGNCRASASSLSAKSIDPKILKFLGVLARKGTYQVNAIGNGCHSPLSLHYYGEAVDLQCVWNGKDSTGQSIPNNSMLEAAKESGVAYYKGETCANSYHHWHFSTTGE